MLALDQYLNEQEMSLSARRAWIEIDIPPNLDADRAVALRKESVDRNAGYLRSSELASTSLSARRAWIEIVLYGLQGLFVSDVALRKESVDRNHVVLVVPAGCWLSLSARRAWIEITSCWRVSGRALRRSPQGERG